ncbi:MAG: OmpA/MotB domain protein [Deltaproteobacteria bacterium]|nr:OmpA/MotB domain protein [Deltaproteobacteria bacterium]
MLMKRMFMFVIALLTCGTAFAAGKADLQLSVARPGATATVDQIIYDGKLLVSVADAQKNPLLGLTAADFSLQQSGRTAKILGVQPIAEAQDVPRNIVLVLDNSYSMEERNAVNDLLGGVSELLKTVRPIDRVQLVVFDNKKSITVGSRKLRVQTFKSSKPAELQAFVEKAYSKDALTTRTVLYEGMLAGLDLISKMPATEPRFLVVFSDGEDLNSKVKREEVLKAAQKLTGFNAFAIDYMESKKADKFLTTFATQNRGQIWKADAESNLVTVFQNVASKMQFFYVVSYIFPPSGKMTVVPASVTIEEVKTIDSSPMLGHVYFDKGASEIPAQYVRFAAPGETTGFDEQKFGDTREKYFQLLNIVGKRLTVNSAATIMLVGCNDNTGVEKGKKKLSAQRAEAVKNYLQTVWNIAPERMTIEARNLPAMPSSINLKEGQAENRRVEIRSTEPLILAPIRSTYLANRIDTPALTLRPEVDALYGIASWKITAVNTSGTLASLSGKGAPPKETKIPLGTGDLKALAGGGDITVKMELLDRKGQSVVLSPDPVKVNFIQTSQRLAQKEGAKVQEKYALILFDFNKATISGVNQEIINRIATRIKALPEAGVEIVGHTDSIGKEAYNIKLSQRRALEAYTQLKAAAGEKAAERIRHSGVGPKNPLYENNSPENRAFNRTVTITLEYMSAE